MTADLDLRRLVVRHRHVSPMLSALLAATDARIRILAADGSVVLDRQAGSQDGHVQRFPVTLERQVIGWVEGGRVGGGIAAVLSYAAGRELDKRSLAAEALDRYRELSLIHDLAGLIGETLEIGAVARVALAEAARLPGGGTSFLLLDDGDGRLAPVPGVASAPLGPLRRGRGIVGAVADGEPELVVDVANDPRTADEERAFASLAVAPLRVRGASLGVVGVGTADRHGYRAGDLKVLVAIAALAGPALDQARRHGPAAFAG